MNAPAISVLMSVRNGERFIDAALASLAAQTFRDFEIVLVENGSGDRTPQIVDCWAAREPRIRLFHFRHPRLAASLNFAAAQARAPLLARLDADDVAYPRRLELQHRALAERPSLGAIGTAAELIDSRGRRLGRLDVPASHRDLEAELRQRCPIVHSSLVMRAELFRQVGGYRDGLNVAEDFDLLSRLVEEREIAALSEPLVGYRVHRLSLTSRHPARIALASACVVAAQDARRRGLLEPFREGVPALRAAATLSRQPGEESRRLVRLAAWRAVVSRGWLLLPLPASLKAMIRTAAIRFRLRPLYAGVLRLLHAGLPARKAATRPAPARSAGT